MTEPSRTPLTPETHAVAETGPDRRSRAASAAEPWWRVGMVWLVIGGPLAVVVAGLVTAVIAVRGADPVLTAEERATFSERPAVQGRNHAATGEVPRRP